MKRIVLMVMMLLLVSVAALSQTNILTRGPLRSISKVNFWQYSSPDTLVSADTVMVGGDFSASGRKVILTWTLLPGEYAIVRDFTVGQNVQGVNYTMYYGISIGANTGKASAATVVWNYTRLLASSTSTAIPYASSSLHEDIVIGPGPLRFELLFANRQILKRSVWYSAWVQFIQPY